jgi:allantoate deiminase
MSICDSTNIDFEKLAAQVFDRCEVIAQCSDEAGKITRLFCSPAMANAHKQIRLWMEGCGLHCQMDSLCNLLGSTTTDDDRPRLLIGSHIDTVPNGGRYDGMLGILLGIGVVEALQSSLDQLPFALSVVAFSEEEGVRYRSPYIGSKAMVGCLDSELLDRVDDQGIRLRDAVKDFGGSVEHLAAARLREGSVIAFLEPHIEQGPVLEAENLAVGIVTGIAGQTRLTARFVGKAGHAGTVPMSMRRDALAAAAMWIQEVERIGQAREGLMATVGHVQVSPNVPNVIPGEVAVRLDARHAIDSVRIAAAKELQLRGESIASERGLELHWERCEEQNAVPTDSDLNALLKQTMEELGLPNKQMVSGAGHDAVYMSRVAPTTMLFVRCRGGISHHPDESVTQADIAVTLRTMVGFIERLSMSYSHK